MGWEVGVNAEGREIGYAVGALCDLPECEKRIDRGLAFVCGGEHDGGEHGCGGYFCYEHLYMTKYGQLCKNCADRRIKARNE